MVCVSHQPGKSVTEEDAVDTLSTWSLMHDDQDSWIALKIYQWFNGGHGAPVSDRSGTSVRQYLAVHCIPLFSQRHLCSAERNLLHIPPHQLSTYACRIFATAGPSTWNNLPNSVDNPNATEVTFRHLLKMFLFSGLWYTEHIMGFSLTMHYIIIHIYFDTDNLWQVPAIHTNY